MTAVLRSLFGGSPHAATSIQSRSNSVSKKDIEANNKQFQDELNGFIHSTQSLSVNNSNGNASQTQDTDELNEAVNSSESLLGTEEVLLSKGSAGVTSDSLDNGIIGGRSIEIDQNTFQQPKNGDTGDANYQSKAVLPPSGTSTHTTIVDLNYFRNGSTSNVFGSIVSAVDQQQEQSDSIDIDKLAATLASNTADETDQLQVAQPGSLPIQQLLPYPATASGVNWIHNAIPESAASDHDTVDSTLSIIEQQNLILQPKAQPEISGAVKDSDIYNTIAGYVSPDMDSSSPDTGETTSIGVTTESEISETSGLGYVQVNNNETKGDPTANQLDHQGTISGHDLNVGIQFDLTDSSSQGGIISNHTYNGEDNDETVASLRNTAFETIRIADNQLDEPVDIKQPAGANNTILAVSEGDVTEASDSQTVPESQQKSQPHSGSQNSREDSASTNSDVTRLKQLDFNQSLRDTLLMESIQGQSSSFTSNILNNTSAGTTSSLGSLASETAIRIDKVVEMRDAAAGKTLSQVTLRIDDANGSPDQIKISARGTALETTIAVSEVNRAEQMLYGTNDLKRSLSQNGFDSNVVRIVSDKETQKEDLSRHKQRNKQQSHEQ